MIINNISVKLLLLKCAMEFYFFLKLKRLYYIKVYFSKENIARHENVISLYKLSVHLQDLTCLNDYVLS